MWHLSWCVPNEMTVFKILELSCPHGAGIPSTMVDIMAFVGHVFAARPSRSIRSQEGGCPLSLQKSSSNASTNTGKPGVSIRMLSLHRAIVEWWCWAIDKVVIVGGHMSQVAGKSRTASTPQTDSFQLCSQFTHNLSLLKIYWIYGVVWMQTWWLSFGRGTGKVWRGMGASGFGFLSN